MTELLKPIYVGIHMSLIEMRTNLLRSVLSVCGVMLGVSSLVALLSLISGIDALINENMVKWAGSVWFMPREIVSDIEKISWSRSPSLKFSDGIFLERHAEQVDFFYHNIERKMNIAVAGIHEHVTVRGIDEKTFKEDLEDIYFSEGSALSPQEFTGGKPSCVISWDLSELLRMRFQLTPRSSQSIIGRTCTINNLVVSIKGIFHPIDIEHKPPHLRYTILLPLSTMRQYLTGYNPDPGPIRIRLNNLKRIDRQLRMIIPLLRSRHRGAEDFDIKTADWVEEIKKMLGNTALLMAIVSTFSLLVGGLNIMNVMLSSISERIHEIGVRMSLGARRLQIFTQFTVEAVTLSCAGGLVGLLLGTAPVLFHDVIYKSTDGYINPTLHTSHLFSVLIIVIAVGVAFGLYPAIKAARMNPVEALRYE